MNILCFGSFSRILKDATDTSNEYLINLLFNPFAPNGIKLHKADISKLINSKLSVPKFIQDSADTPAIMNTIEEYFKENIIIHIKQIKLHKLIALFIDLINGDKTIPDEQKYTLLSNANETELSTFLSKIFLYAIQQDNKLENSYSFSVPNNKSSCRIFNEVIYIDGEKIPLPKPLIPPNNVDIEELAYITELLKAYADCENNTEFTIDTLPEKYIKNFNDQRINYYNAESVRRTVRDIEGLDVQFDYFIEDTYHAVIDLCSQSHANGYERLLKVLQQSANRPQGRSVLEKMLNWIGPSEKKGACHILVNKGKLNWVNNHEENF